ncbi:hypothetical protein QR680_011256 [Steinernema hermaphroditum]|uniref:Uncharacterized protein n=1 Tax=Steinernema hermaphroditum TaxID=289476 RepID=A0AA39IRM6_9BILA|nr:hypothetical protein QR680_011256 [Steinernema hermaphroditum]
MGVDEEKREERHGERCHRKKRTRRREEDAAQVLLEVKTKEAPKRRVVASSDGEKAKNKKKTRREVKIGSDPSGGQLPLQWRERRFFEWNADADGFSLKGEAAADDSRCDRSSLVEIVAMVSSHNGVGVVIIVVDDDADYVVFKTQHNSWPAA